MSKGGYEAYLFSKDRCLCENLQNGTKRSLAGSLYGNGLGQPSRCKFLSAELTWCRWHGVSRMALFLRQKMPHVLF